jgi:hypothetical protein
MMYVILCLDLHSLYFISGHIDSPQVLIAEEEKIIVEEDTTGSQNIVEEK